MESLSESYSGLSGLSEILSDHAAQQIFEDETIKPILEDLYQNNVTNVIFENNHEMEHEDQKNIVEEYIPVGDLNNFNSQMYNHIPLPPSVISNEEYPGPYNFEVFISPVGKNPWVYSPPLRKIFIGINNPFPVDFKTDPAPIRLFVRAMPLFSLPQYSKELVLRCIPHAQKSDSTNLNLAPHVLDHVIRCQNSSAVYEGSKTDNKHLSVVVPLSSPQTGTDTVRELYQFVCKNSCPSGMNRKPLEVVFTLEDEGRQILGRKLLNVRVCSCPKRDKEKEEKETSKKSDTLPVPHGKRRKLDKSEKKIEKNSENKEYVLNLKIPGKEFYSRILQSTYDSFHGEIARNQDQAREQQLRKCVQEIEILIKNISE